MATPKRDPKTGRFAKTTTNVDNPSRKSKKKKKSKHVARKGGKFAKFTDTVRFYGGPKRKSYVLERLDTVKEKVESDYEQFDAISFESLTEIFALLSDDSSRALVVWFLYLPHYSNFESDKPDIGNSEPVKATFIGEGLGFITKIVNWLQSEAVIADIETHRLAQDDYKMTFTRPLWDHETAPLENGKNIVGTGVQKEWWGNKKRKKEVDYRNPPRKRDRTREKLVEKERLKEQGKKRNKGNVREQKRRARERKKKQKEQENK